MASESKRGVGVPVGIHKAVAERSKSIRGGKTGFVGHVWTAAAGWALVVPESVLKAAVAEVRELTESLLAEHRDPTAEELKLAMKRALLTQEAEAAIAGALHASRGRESAPRPRRSGGAGGT